MKHTTTLCITIVCISYTLYAMELVEPKKKEINAQGMRPLFYPLDKEGIARFNLMHRQLVDHLKDGPIFQPWDEVEWHLGRIQHDLTLLKKQHDNLGSKEYLKKLIKQHEAEQQINLKQSTQALSQVAILNATDKYFNEFLQTAEKLEKKRALITELEALLESNQIGCPDDSVKSDCSIEGYSSEEHSE